MTFHRHIAQNVGIRFVQTNDLYFNLATFLQLLHFLCNKTPFFLDK